LAIADPARKILYTVVYVAPFYLSSYTRPSAQLSRDAPSVIKARITSVTLSCAVCSAATFYVLTAASLGAAPSQAAAHLMGYWPPGLREAAAALLLTAGLFLGPLFEMLVAKGGWRDWLSLAPLRGLFYEWTEWRNIVAVSPPPPPP